MRFLIMTVAVAFLVSLSGCCSSHSQGICDCDYDDYCASRAPWVRSNVMTAPIGEKIAPPSKLPDLKNKGL